MNHRKITVLLTLCLYAVTQPSFADKDNTCKVKCEKKEKEKDSKKQKTNEPDKKNKHVYELEANNNQSIKEDVGERKLKWELSPPYEVKTSTKRDIHTNEVISYKSELTMEW